MIATMIGIATANRERLVATCLKFRKD